MAFPKMQWSPESWRHMPVHEQGIPYEDGGHLDLVLQRISDLPPLVVPSSIDHARKQHAAAFRGEVFLLMGGDCAENFDDIRADIIEKKASLLVDQARYIEQVTSKPVLVTGRMAGQYSKPRSQLVEILSDGRKVHAFRGHNINGPGDEDRNPDAGRLLQGYWHAVATMHMLHGAERTIYTGHEALHLPLETAQTKDGYNTSATFLWIGERTRQLDGAHIEYVRGLKNPIGIKIGPSTSAAYLVEMLGKLDAGEEGRVTLITRFGAEKVGAVLPNLVQAVVASGYRPVWMCDPCHGNTLTLNGIKTRKTTTMLSEVAQTIRILARFDTHLGGLHLEQTGENVTECTGPELFEHKDPASNYTSLCDPRLSGIQAKWLVEKVAHILEEARDDYQTQALTSTHVPMLWKMESFIRSWLPEELGQLESYMQIAKGLWRISIGRYLLN